MGRGPMREPTKDALRRELAQAQRDLLRLEGAKDAYRDIAMSRGVQAEQAPRRLRRIK